MKCCEITHIKEANFCCICGKRLEKDQLLRIKEISKMTNISYTSIRNACVRGELASTRFAPKGAFHVSRSDLDNWIESNKNTNPLQKIN